MGKLLSVIVPCYNDGKYIERCLKSILNQTYSNLEIIVINDGSTDNSEEVIKSINDDRIKYFYKENSGVSDTRNVGLDNAKGELIAFVDSDDTIEPTMFEELIKLMNENEADISHCSYNRINGIDIKRIGNSNKIITFNNNEGIMHFFKGNLYTGGIWNKIFKIDIIGELRFEKEIRINEDVLFCFLAFKNAKKTVFYDRCFYNYYVSDTSSCISTNGVKVAEDCHTVSCIILENSSGEKYEDSARRRSFGSLASLYRAYIYEGDASQKKKAKVIKKEIIKLYDDGELIGNLKINAMMIKYFGILYKPLYSIYNKIRKPNWDINEGN